MLILAKLFKFVSSNKSIVGEEYLTALLEYLDLCGAKLSLIQNQFITEALLQ